MTDALNISRETMCGADYMHDTNEALLNMYMLKCLKYTKVIKGNKNKNKKKFKF